MVRIPACAILVLALAGPAAAEPAKGRFTATATVVAPAALSLRDGGVAVAAQPRRSVVVFADHGRPRVVALDAAGGAMVPRQDGRTLVAVAF